MSALVRVWLVDLNVEPELAARLASLLTVAEQARAAGYAAPADGRRWAVARAAARSILAGTLGVPAPDVAWHTGRYGKPEIDGVHFNLSHSGELALVAVADRPVGVDLEQIRPGPVGERIARRYFPTAEAAWLARQPSAHRPVAYARLWTRKEACVKATGGRLADALRLPVLGGAPPDRYLCEVPVPPGYTATVALLGRQPARLVSDRWPAGQATGPPRAPR